MSIFRSAGPARVSGVLRAGGRPVAILRNSEVVAYFIPADLAHPEWADPGHPGYGSWDEVFAALNLREEAGPPLHPSPADADTEPTS